MVGFAIALCAGFFFCLKFRSKKSDPVECMFFEELRKIKTDSVVNFIDEGFLRRNFELFGDLRFSVAANDEGHEDYPITSLQDLTPQDLA